MYLLATQRGSLRQVSNLLRGTYGETGEMDFGLVVFYTFIIIGDRTPHAWFPASRNART